MSATDARPCPSCGSADTEAFADESGRCRNCGRAFRGSTPIGAMIQGEKVEVRHGIKARERVKAGMLGFAGGLLGWAGVPAVFALGAILHGRSGEDYIATVSNTPAGALVCGGVIFLAFGGVYAMWAGASVWQGFPERALHLIIAGAIIAAAGAVAGGALAGSVGIAGGVLALVGGILAWREARARKAAETAPATAGT